MLISLNVADERLTTAHRAKLAYVYVRQSSMNQVRQHQESIIKRQVYATNREHHSCPLRSPHRCRLSVV